jgi:hypothetical protein
VGRGLNLGLAQVGRYHNDEMLLHTAFRGDEGNRTPDIYLAKVALCQLSYVPEGNPQVSSATGIFRGD